MAQPVGMKQREKNKISAVRSWEKQGIAIAHIERRVSTYLNSCSLRSSIHTQHAIISNRQTSTQETKLWKRKENEVWAGSKAKRELNCNKTTRSIKVVSAYRRSKFGRNNNPTLAPRLHSPDPFFKTYRDRHSMELKLPFRQMQNQKVSKPQIYRALHRRWQHQSVRPEDYITRNHAFDTHSCTCRFPLLIAAINPSSILVVTDVMEFYLQN